LRFKYCSSNYANIAAQFGESACIAFQEQIDKAQSVVSLSKFRTVTIIDEKINGCGNSFGSYGTALHRYIRASMQAGIEIDLIGKQH
jgi:hypothetical protein